MSFDSKVMAFWLILILFLVGVGFGSNLMSRAHAQEAPVQTLEERQVRALEKIASEMARMRRECR